MSVNYDIHQLCNRTSESSEAVVSSSNWSCLKVLIKGLQILFSISDSVLRNVNDPLQFGIKEKKQCWHFGSC